MEFSAGFRIGRWVLLSPAPKDRNNNSRWECQCECGNTRTVLRNNLAAGRSRQCEDCSNRERRETAAFRPKVPKVRLPRPPRKIPGLRLSYMGRSLRLSQWEAETGLPTECIRNRLKRKWTVGQALGFEKRIPTEDLMKSEWKTVTSRMKEAPLKCDGERRVFCKTMENALGSSMANEHRKGFVPIVVTNMTTGKDRLIGVAYRKSASDTGLMMNHCPFCGVEILWEGASKKESDPQAA